jgi:hypothetical protein
MASLLIGSVNLTTQSICVLVGKVENQFPELGAGGSRVRLTSLAMTRMRRRSATGVGVRASSARRRE